MEFALSPTRLTRTLGGVVLLLTAAHLAGLISTWRFGHDSVFGLVPLFDLNNEANVPTFYASFSFVLCGALAALAALGCAQRRERFVARWSGLAVVFLFLALDEYASLHERLSDPVRAALGTGGLLVNAWVIPYGAAGLALLVVYLPLLAALPTRTRWLLLGAGAIFVTGAIGMEMLAGPAKEAAAGRPSLAVACCTTVEELLEMLGVLLAIHALAMHVARQRGGAVLRLVIADAGPSATGHAREPATRRWRSILAAKLLDSTRRSTTTGRGDDTDLPG